MCVTVPRLSALVRCGVEKRSVAAATLRFFAVGEMRLREQEHFGGPREAPADAAPYPARGGVPPRRAHGTLCREAESVRVGHTLP